MKLNLGISVEFFFAHSMCHCSKSILYIPNFCTFFYTFFELSALKSTPHVWKIWITKNGPERV